MKATFCSSILFWSCSKKDATSPIKSNSLENVQASSISKASITGSKNGPIGVCYVEVNNNSMDNVGKYTLQSSGKQLFDIGIIFAANINYDATQQKAVLYNNTQVTSVLNNAATTIQPLQAKGIKVMLSILGNHQGVGISNFTSRAAAHDFALQLSNAVTTYGLDGIDFDDEYAEYGQHGSLPNSNDSSFMLLLQELRSLIPNKLITFYYIGPSISHLTYNGTQAGSYVDYSWNPYYGTFSAPSVPGLGNANLGPAATDVTATSQSTAVSMANSTKSGGYGVYLYYNLDATDRSGYLSAISNVLYNENTVYNTSATTTTGVVFYKDSYYNGAATNGIPKGSYTLTQLQSYGFVNDWASSVKIQSGWTLTLYSDDNFSGTSWTLTSDNNWLGALSPSANDVVSSVKIQ